MGDLLETSGRSPGDLAGISVGDLRGFGGFGGVVDLGVAVDFEVVVDLVLVRASLTRAKRRQTRTQQRWQRGYA